MFKFKHTTFSKFRYVGVEFISTLHRNTSPIFSRIFPRFSILEKIISRLAAEYLLSCTRTRTVFEFCFKRSHSCILIGNSCDDRCFLKCIVAALCDKGKNMGRWLGNMKKLWREYFLTFPTTSKVMKKYEQKWPVSINVYGHSGIIYLHYLSSTLLQSDRQVVNLLLHSRHYFLIRNMSTLVTPQCKTNNVMFALLVCCILFVRIGMKLIFISARKMALSTFSLRRMKLSWGFLLSTVW